MNNFEIQDHFSQSHDVYIDVTTYEERVGGYEVRVDAYGNISHRKAFRLISADGNQFSWGPWINGRPLMYTSATLSTSLYA